MGKPVAMEMEHMWLLIFGVHRKQIVPFLDPKVYLLVIKMVSNYYACTHFELGKMLSLP